MKTILSSRLSRRVLASCISAAIAIWLPCAPHVANAAAAVAKPSLSAPVTIADNGATWTLDNGIVKAVIDKKNSNLLSVVYHGIDTLAADVWKADPPESATPSWEQRPSGTVTSSITIDPAKNGGDRAEVAVKGINGRMDIEIRYTMQRGLSGVYTYAEFSHRASYPAAGEGESRFILQLDPSFVWFSVDANRNQLIPSTQEVAKGVVIHAIEQEIIPEGPYKNTVEHKYSYAAELYKIPAWGFSSPKNHIGAYLINPTTEYIGGGASRLDLIGPFSQGSNNTIQDYWTSGHYGGGAGCSIPAGEEWKKVIGPILIYYNALADPETPTQAGIEAFKATEGNPTLPPAWTNNANALWQDALAAAKIERGKWPFDWVNGVDYPHKDGRADVAGQFALDDPQAASAKLPHLTVGLSHPDYTGRGGSFAERSGDGSLVTWKHDGNYYQFWADGSDDGKFTITGVRPGKYTLHAFADNVLGEYAKTDITVEAGKPLDLGKLDWKPLRYGKQVWEIGYPDRTGGKFFKGDGENYWLWGWCVRYPLLFPKDITYTVGKSDYRKDWFFEEVPHGESTAWLNPEAKDPANQRFGWVKNGTPGEDMWRTIGRGRATTWTVKFNMDQAAHGLAVLRVALAGSDGTGGLIVGVNGKPVGTVRYISTNALRYNTDRGVWRQYTQPFDASLLKAGENEMSFTVPAGDLTTGVVWDYLRLELNEDAKPGSVTAMSSGM